MKNLVTALNWIFFVFVSQSAIAAVNTYQCLISEQLLLETNGELKRPPKPYLIGQRFAVDRNTGHIVGAEQALWKFNDQKIIALARGNADNSFTVISSGSASGNGVHSFTIRVLEYAPGKAKPFVVLSGAEVASGVCE